MPNNKKTAKKAVKKVVTSNLTETSSKLGNNPSPAYLRALANACPVPKKNLSPIYIDNNSNVSKEVKLFDADFCDSLVNIYTHELCPLSYKQMQIAINIGKHNVVKVYQSVVATELKSFIGINEMFICSKEIFGSEYIKPLINLINPLQFQTNCRELDCFFSLEALTSLKFTLPARTRIMIVLTVQPV